MLEYLKSGTGFNLSDPQLILSVTGGAQQFTCDEDTKRGFKLGLMKAAKTTNAWIITGGTNYGVMKLVGDAVAEDINAHGLTVLGIATWGTDHYNTSLHT
jgi:transient receptor potential cation channel subfamily M protein 2